MFCECDDQILTNQRVLHSGEGLGTLRPNAQRGSASTANRCAREGFHQLTCTHCLAQTLEVLLTVPHAHELQKKRTMLHVKDEQCGVPTTAVRMVLQRASVFVRPRNTACSHQFASVAERGGPTTTRRRTITSSEMQQSPAKLSTSSLLPLSCIHRVSVCLPPARVSRLDEWIEGRLTNCLTTPSFVDSRWFQPRTECGVAG